MGVALTGARYRCPCRLLWPHGPPRPGWAHARRAAARLSGNRFDAPDGEYRSIYLASAPYGCYLEKLTAFRHERPLEQRVLDSFGNGDDPDYPDGPDPGPGSEHEFDLFPNATPAIPAVNSHRRM